MIKDTFTEVLARMSVDMGGLHVPAMRALDYSVKFCCPLLFQNSSNEYPVSVSGSSFLFKYRGRCFQIATQHQLESQDRDAQEVRVALPQQFETLLLSPKKSFALNKQSDKDRNADFRIWEYDGNLDERFRSCFLNVTTSDFSDIPPAGSEKVIVYYTVSYPSSAQEVDLDDEGFRLVRMRNCWAKVHVIPDPNALKLIDHRIYMRCTDTMADMSVSSDGFSGAPVFAVYQTADYQCRFAFCGLITDGDDDGRIAVYPARVLFRALQFTFQS